MEGSCLKKMSEPRTVLWEGNQPDIFSVRAASQRSRSERVGGTALISSAGRDHCLAYPALSPRGTASLAPSCSRSSLPQCCPPRRRVNGPVENTQTPAQKTHTHSQTHTSAICQRNVQIRKYMRHDNLLSTAFIKHYLGAVIRWLTLALAHKAFLILKLVSLVCGQ